MLEMGLNNTYSPPEHLRSSPDPSSINFLSGGCRANNLMLAELDKLRAKKYPERLAKKALAGLQQTLQQAWRAARRQAALQEEVAAKEKGKQIDVAPAPGDSLGSPVSMGFTLGSLPSCCSLRSTGS